MEAVTIRTAYCTSQLKIDADYADCCWLSGHALGIVAPTDLYPFVATRPLHVLQNGYVSTSGTPKLDVLSSTTVQSMSVPVMLFYISHFLRTNSRRKKGQTIGTLILLLRRIISSSISENTPQVIIGSGLNLPTPRVSKRHSQIFRATWAHHMALSKFSFRWNHPNLLATGSKGGDKSLGLFGQKHVQWFQDPSWPQPHTHCGGKSWEPRLWNTAGLRTARSSTDR